MPSPPATPAPRAASCFATEAVRQGRPEPPLPPFQPHPSPRLRQIKGGFLRSHQPSRPQEFLIGGKDLDLPIMIHTPHRDKKRGTLRTMDVLAEHGFDPNACVIDHNNEETVEDVLDRGYWAAFSIYPGTKMGNERMTEIVRRYGPERLIVDSACDWGVSDPLAVPKTARLMAERGIDADAIRTVTYANALAVYGLNGEMREEHWLSPAPVDQRTLYEGNSILRGGQTPRIEAPRRDLTDLQIT